MYLEMIVQRWLVSVDQRRETVREEKYHECQVNDPFVDLRQNVKCTNDQCTSAVNSITVDLAYVGAVDGLILNRILFVIDVIDRIISKWQRQWVTSACFQACVLPERTLKEEHVA